MPSAAESPEPPMVVIPQSAIENVSGLSRESNVKNVSVEPNIESARLEVKSKEPLEKIISLLELIILLLERNNA